MYCQETSQVFGTLSHVTVNTFPEMAVFGEWSKQDFHSLWLWKYVTYFDHLFSLKMLKICYRVHKWKNKSEKKFVVFQIIAFELRIAGSRNIQQDTWHRQAMCQQTHVRFHLTRGKTFSKSNLPRIIKKHEKCTLRQASQVFGTLSHVDCQYVFWNGGFWRVI